jgi:acyl-CoA synthetase (NDP forming)
VPTDLGRFFNPRSIAVIGASSNPAAIGGKPLRVLQAHGFAGELFAVNPRYAELDGVRCLPSIGAVPSAVDLAIVAVPARLVPAVLDECSRAGVRFALIYSSGFAEAGDRASELQSALRDAIAHGSTRVCGPNCEGYFNLWDGVATSFSPTVDPERAFRPSEPGHVAVVSQSGGLGFALYHRGLEVGLRFSTIVSTGNEADLDALDYLDHLVDDPRTKLIMGFIESFKGGRRLVDIARRALEARKPLIVAKIGRSEAGRHAAMSHTGSLAGADDVCDAALRQLGVIRAHDIEEMLDAATYLSVGRPPIGRRVLILTVSGGSGAWLADACAERGLELPEVEPTIQQRLREILPVYGATRNPVDVTAQVITSHEALEASFHALAESERFDTLATVMPLASRGAFEHVLPAIREQALTGRRAMLHFSYTTPLEESVDELRALGIPCFSSPGRAATALSWAYWWGQAANRVAAVRIYEATPRATIDAPVGTSESAVRDWLGPCGIPSPREVIVSSATEARRAAEEIGRPVVLKIVSPDIVHKSDVGGVEMGLATPADVESAYYRMLERIARSAPAARIEGALVQEMVEGGREMILGAVNDADFGPIVVVGFGGIDVELLGDVSRRLAPVSPAEARAMIGELRGAALLDGFRGRPRADIDALVDAIVRFAEFAARMPGGVRSFEINPLVVLPAGRGVIMLDAAVDLSEESK